MDLGPKAHCNFRKKVGKDVACIFIIMYMLINIVSLLEDCMTHSLMFVVYLSVTPLNTINSIIKLIKNQNLVLFQYVVRLKLWSWC